MNKIKITIVSLLVLCLHISWKNTEKETQQILEKNSLRCSSMSRASSIVSGLNLETDVLDEIDVIEPNQQIGEPFQGMVKISGGVFEMRVLFRKK